MIMHQVILMEHPAHAPDLSGRSTSVGATTHNLGLVREPRRWNRATSTPGFMLGSRRSQAPGVIPPADQDPPARLACHVEAVRSARRSPRYSPRGRAGTDSAYTAIQN